MFGNTGAVKAAECGQVIEAYSVIVTGASAGPSAMSGNDIGLPTSAAFCAMASVISRSGEKPASAANPVSERTVVKARRVMINGLLLIGAFTPKVPDDKPLASLKRPSWQWQGAPRQPRRPPNFPLA